MSDFIFTSTQVSPGYLTQVIQTKYHEDFPEVTEFQGNWGSLGVSRNLYTGFEPYETGTSICLVLGGPVLQFTDNQFLSGLNRNIGTQYIYEKWMRDPDRFIWDEELSGPFACLILEKENNNLRIITDLMSFIPLYEANYQSIKIFGSHIDMVAKAGGFDKEQDMVSIADFIMHGTVTYPYTIYQPARQLAPATIHKWKPSDGINSRTISYWKPLEKYTLKNMDQMADRLREALASYIKQVTKSMDQVATFLSGGEDSRVILALLPKNIQRDAYIFLNEENRESRIARKVARLHGARFHSAFRLPSRYLDVLPACSDLVGAGSQYISTHTYGFHKRCTLMDYSAVFGGFLSDTLLKGYNKLSYRRQEFSIEHCPFRIDIVLELKARRKEHLKRVAGLRLNTAREWFSIWPLTMHSDLSNIHGNRRLFRSYEPFTANKVVKIAATVPQHWKLNRSLFHRMARPLFKSTKRVPHANGWIPYYPGRRMHVPFYNYFLFRSLLRWRKKEKKSYQGTWCDWNAVMQSKIWKDAIERYVKTNTIPQELINVPVENLFKDSRLTTLQKVNLLQVSYLLGKKSLN